MNSDMRVTTPSGLNTYPDVSVYCGDPELTDNNHTLLNPSLIIEVLSPSTRNYDQGDKFTHYRSIVSLQDYLLVESQSVHIAHYQRQGEHEWLLREHQSLEDELHLRSLQIQIIVESIYEKVDFE